MVLILFTLADFVKDLPRTFAGHPWLETKEAQASLRRVLVAYSFRDSAVGYCQVRSIICSW